MRMSISGEETCKRIFLPYAREAWKDKEDSSRLVLPHV